MHPQQIKANYGAAIHKLEAALHSNPEVSFQEREATRHIREALAPLGVSLLDLGMETGVVAKLRGQGEAPPIGLRADIDAIPQTEAVVRADCSAHPGMMHACGHDVHAASLFGAALALAALPHGPAGDVYFIFQPGEETLGGAQAMLEHGLLSQAPISMLFGLHNTPALTVGKVGLLSGPCMSAKDDFILTMQGKGGHGGMPHRTVDPIVCAAAFISNAQTIVSRNIDPFDSAVVSVCSIHAGTKENLIVDQAVMTGSVRTFTPCARKTALSRLQEIAQNTASAFGCRAELEIQHLVPALQNDAALYPIALQAAQAALGEVQVQPFSPCMASEDFALFAQQVPSFFYFLGSGFAGQENAPWHSPSFRAHPDTSCYGAALLYQSVICAQNS